MLIGFINSPFPVIPGTERDHQDFPIIFRGRFRETVTVMTVDLKVGEQTFPGVITSDVSISRHLPLHGFASHCHVDEAEGMELAVKLYAEERGKIIGIVYNNWPSFRGYLRDKTNQESLKS